MLEWTEHARQRWAERLAHLVPEHEYYLARPVSKGLKRHIAATCPAHEEFTKQGFKGRYFLRSHNVIWVMAPPEKVITVWPLPDNFKPKLSKRRLKRMQKMGLIESTGSPPTAPVRSP